MMNVLSALVRLLAGEPIAASACKFHPSCSEYAYDAVRKHGPVRGSLKALWRIVRCNPWTHGGVDYA
jgi:putative membrane protein insertion efficiency factor